MNTSWWLIRYRLSGEWFSGPYGKTATTRIPQEARWYPSEKSAFDAGRVLAEHGYNAEDLTVDVLRLERGVFDVE